MMNRKIINLLLTSVLIFFSHTIIGADITRSGSEILISGEIIKGDYRKFMGVLRQSFIDETIEGQAFKHRIASGDYKIVEGSFEHDASKFAELPKWLNIQLTLNSQGGDLHEAMLIGDVVRKSMLATEAGAGVYTSQTGRKGVCLSACFYIWVAGIDRDSDFRRYTEQQKRFETPESKALAKQLAELGHTPSTEQPVKIGIHRAYYSRDYYAKLPTSEVEAHYRKLRQDAERYLDRMGVSKGIIEKNFNIPSGEIYYLTEEEHESLAVVVPFYDELLTSKCGSFTPELEHNFSECKYTYPAILKDDKSFSVGNLRKDKILSMCSSVSLEKLAKLEKDLDYIRTCRLHTHRAISWESVDVTLSITKKNPHLLDKPGEFYVKLQDDPELKASMKIRE